MHTRFVAAAATIAIVAFALTASACAEAFTTVRGDFGEEQGPVVTDQNALLATSASSNDPGSGNAYYTGSATSDGRRISYAYGTGPIMYAYSQRGNGPFSFATTTSTARWSDMVRLDDGGDPATLDVAPANYLANLYLGLHVEFFAQVPAQGGAELNIAFDDWSQYAGFFTPTSWSGTNLLMSVAAKQPALVAGVPFSLEESVAIDYGTANASSQGWINIQYGKTYFTLNDSAGHQLTENPYNLRIVSTDLPSRVYPMRPGFAALQGDYNRDGKVDAADYILWRKSLGTSTTPGENADGTGDGLISPADYGTWRNNFGATPSISAGAGVGASANVPEPSTALLAVTAFAAPVTRRRRSRWAGGRCAAQQSKTG